MQQHVYVDKEITEELVASLSLMITNYVNMSQCLPFFSRRNGFENITFGLFTRYQQRESNARLKGF